MRKTWNKFFLLICVLFLAFCVPQDTYGSVNSIQASAAAVSSSKIELKWNAIDEADSYAIYRRTSSDAVFQKINVTSSTTYRDTKISAAVYYYYQIVPIHRETGEELQSAQATVKVKTPAEVSIERITVKASTKLQLYWQVSAGSSGYQVFRSESENGSYTEIARINGKATCTYTDKEVIPGKTYYYKIRPTNQAHKGVGAYSAPVKGRTIAQTTITSIASLSSDQMQIIWKKVSGAQTYEVYRSRQKNSGYKKIATLRNNTRKYIDKSVKSGKKYYYKIVASGTLDGVAVSSGYSEAASSRALQQVKISSVKVTADDGLKIKWNKVTGATKYKIYRASSKTGTYKNIATVSGVSVLAYTDKKVVSGKTYYYRVQAYSDGKGVISAGNGTISEAKGASTAYAIMGESTVTVEQMAALYNASGKKYPASVYKEKGASNIEKFCEIVLDECEKEGVRAEVIFAQVCLETGYLQFGGQVSAEQCNFSGIGATDDGAAGATFKNVRTGIRAQVQHLKGYASTEDLNQKCVDPRFIYLSYKRGCAKYVQNLGNGNWATDPAYAVKLMGLIKAMKSY